MINYREIHFRIEMEFVITRENNIFPENLSDLWFISAWEGMVMSDSNGKALRESWKDRKAVSGISEINNLKIASWLFFSNVKKRLNTNHLI